MAQNDFFKKVYKVTKKIPYGKVSTYGDIAEALEFVHQLEQLVGH